MRKDKKILIDIRHYDEEYKTHKDELLKFYGCVSVILTESELRIIEHESDQKTIVIPRTKYDAVTVRNWGNE